ncbi:protein disulfide-isomerase A3-like [Sitodiplosis mosellana]|uniref:protein disulfide-isomerase A3-like n=1 Tax=Sitodiplosis mosellana TaxID=263140 RepID=UPI0024437A53|nr:protein disulfide-isomerase A3-like [Sitodiplosis mosellana]
MTVFVTVVGKVPLAAANVANRNLQAQLAATNAANRNLQAQLDAMNKKLDDLTQEVKDLQSRLKISGPASKQLDSLKELEEYLQVQETTLIGFFGGDSSLKLTFQAYADKYREKKRFGHTSAADLLKKYGVTDGIILFRAPQYANKFEENQVEFDGSGIEELTTFVKGNFHGLVGHRTRDNAAEFNRPVVVAYVKNPEKTNHWRSQMLEVVPPYAGMFSFAISSKDEFQHEHNEYGYDYTGDKPVVLARDERNQKFIMKDEFSIENLKAFLDDLKGGKLEPYLKSEPVPEDNNGPVKVAVAKNFEDLITNNGKDTLIEFYSPWCRDCKKFFPVYDELAEKLADEDVFIAKFDATANDVPPEFEVRDFPTLFWLPKDSKSKPVKYEGIHEVNELLKYIAKHATIELKGFNRDGEPKIVD